MRFTAEAQRSQRNAGVFRAGDDSAYKPMWACVTHTGESECPRCQKEMRIVALRKKGQAAKHKIADNPTNSTENDLDAAVFEAYGWQDFLPSRAPRLCARISPPPSSPAGTIRWLRPEYQSDGVTVQRTHPATLGSPGRLIQARPATLLYLITAENGFMVRLSGSKSNATIKNKFRPP